MPLEPDDFYYDNGLIVLTESYHLKRGYCCGNNCRHCPFDHENVPKDLSSEPKTANEKSE